MNLGVSQGGKGDINLYALSPGDKVSTMDGRRVGVLGGGQLGRMMAEAGHRLGIQLAILDPCTVVSVLLWHRFCIRTFLSQPSPCRRQPAASLRQAKWRLSPSRAASGMRSKSGRLRNPDHVTYSAWGKRLQPTVDRFNDPNPSCSLRELAAVSDLLTVEIEHVNCDALEVRLRQSGKHRRQQTRRPV